MKPRHDLNPREKAKRSKRVRVRKPHAPKGKRKPFKSPFDPDAMMDLLGPMVLQFMLRQMGIRGRDLFGLFAKLYPLKPEGAQGVETPDGLPIPPESGTASTISASRSRSKKRKNPGVPKLNWKA